MKVPINSDKMLVESELTGEMPSAKDTFFRWAARVTFHGIASLFNPKAHVVVRLVWVVSFVLAVFYCTKFISKDIGDFFRFEVDTVLELAPNDESDFPTVTFCTMQVCGFERYDLNRTLEDYIDSEKNKYSNARQVINEKLSKNSTKTNFFLAKEIFLRGKDSEELNRVLGRNSTTLTELLISCYFDGRKCDAERDFEIFEMGEFTRCFKFKERQPQNESSSSSSARPRVRKMKGLHLELFIGSPSQCKAPLSTTSGVHVYVHNKTYTLTEEDNSFLVQPGSETSIAIPRTDVEKLAYPYSNCISSSRMSSYHSSLIEKTINITGLYTQQYCLQLCFQEFLIQYCNCYSSTLPKFSPPNQRSCPKFIDSLYDCQYIIKRLFYNGKNDRHCLRDCPNECQYTKYDATVTSSLFPSQSYLLTLNSVSQSALNRTLSAESVLALNIFHQSDSFTRIVERPRVQLEYLITNLGGILGLFMGGSLLSFVEILELVYHLIERLVEKSLFSSRYPKSHAKFN